MEEDTFKIICPFCNAPYTAEMEEDFEASFHDGTCSQCTGTDVWGNIDIICSNCSKLIYRKEFSKRV